MEMVSITSGIVHFYFPLFVHLNSIIYNSLPFSAGFPDLGRDFQPAVLGFSTFSADFPDLGRDFQPAATGFLYPFG